MGTAIFLLVFVVGIPAFVIWFAIHQSRKILRKHRLETEQLEAWKRAQGQHQQQQYPPQYQQHPQQ